VNLAQQAIAASGILPFLFDDLESGRADPTNHRFPGQYADSENSLNYNNMRDYDSSTGFYIEADPIGLAGGLFPFAYAGQNPTQAIDPQGLDLVFLNDSKKPEITGLGPVGHAAFLVGNDAYGWTYYSKNGQTDGRDVNSRMSFKSMDDFFRSQAAARYDRTAYIKTGLSQDLAVESYADRHFSDAYSSTGYNCGDLVHDSFAVAGVTIPAKTQYGVTIPNDQYDGITRQLGGMSVPTQQGLYPHTPIP
jgi:RHS repeat-associated protein